MFYKKIIGTTILLVLLLGTTLTTYSFVSACTNPQSNFMYDGVVTTKSSSSVTLAVSGRGPITVRINEDVHLVDGLRSGDIITGDHLKIDAKKENSSMVARTVKRISRDSGYGRISKVGY